MRIYGYLRASTKEQDAERAKSLLSGFALEKGLTVCSGLITPGTLMRDNTSQRLSVRATKHNHSTLTRQCVLAS